MKFELGIYKLQSRGSFQKAHYLKVYFVEGQKYYNLNGGVSQPLEDGHFIIDNYRVMGKVRQPVVSKNVRITLEWEDHEGDTFELSARDFQLLKNFFKDFPEIAKSAGSRKKY